MNFWQRRRSFWTTPAGFMVQTAGILIILGGALMALNLFTSPFPVIEYLTASPAVISSGDASILSWSVAGAASIEIDQGIGRVQLKGEREIFPSQTTTYTLTAFNDTRTRSKSVRIIVEP